MTPAGRPLRALVLLSICILAMPSAASRASAEGGKFQGSWKLIVLAFGEDEFAIIDIAQNQDGPTASVASAQRAVVGAERELKIAPITISGDTLKFTLNAPAGAFRFQGKLVENGPNAGKVLGVFPFRGEVHPARMERTTSERVADLRPGPMAQEYFSLRQVRDPRSKVQKLRAAIERHEDSPTNHLFYAELIGSAEAGGLSPDEVRELVQKWVKESLPYGEAWASEVRRKVLKALGASKTYAEIVFELAQQAEKDLDDESPVEQQTFVLGALARSAALVGKPDLAAKAKARSEELERRIDAEYKKNIPPFQPEKFPGRKSPHAGRVVLVELFTGAQCPPCVAADVAFDALLETYKPTEVIGLQYHLHIPRPDPLTNKDTEARAEYYGDELQGTPTFFINGVRRARGGGPLSASRDKYQELRGILDPELESPRDARVELSASRAGDQIEIKASAKLTAGARDKEEPNQGELARPSLRLRVALVEESIRYVGSNRLRFHHHVVRAMPGGTEGKSLDGGSGEVQISLSRAELQRELQEYVSDRAKRRPFSGTLPEITLDHLSVVAFVQDDADKSVLDAVAVPLNSKNP